MARNVITEPIAGETCSICWGTGKPFGTFPTPSVVTANFIDIEQFIFPAPPASPLLNVVLQLSQFAPCDFRGEAGAYSARWALFADATLCRLQFGPATLFTESLTGPCEVELPGNDFASLPFARGGVCQITF